jgi:4-hydroxy-2-oxoheptanedioate aldolase
MIHAHSLLAALRSRQSAFGAWITIPSTHIARSIVQSSSNLSWLCIDCEHGLTSLHPGAADLMMAMENAPPDANNPLRGSRPSTLVRIPAAGRMDGGDDGLAWQVKYALDAGAKGVVVPMVRAV